MKKLLLGVTLYGLFLISPANAMDAMTCDEASMTKMQTDMGAMADPAIKANKDMAMKYMDQAKAAMTAKNMEECSAQMGMAKMSMTMKCDDASMAMMKTQMDGVTDPAMKANKDEAMKNMTMAMASMKDKKTDECMTQMGAAMDAMHKKM